MTLTIPDFSVARVLVAGDVMLDRYLFGGTSRISPEAPVPVVHVRKAKGHELPGVATLAAHAQEAFLEPPFTPAPEKFTVTAAAPSQVAADLLTSPGRGPQEAEALIQKMTGTENAWRKTARP